MQTMANKAGKQRQRQKEEKQLLDLIECYIRLPSFEFFSVESRSRISI